MKKHKTPPPRRRFNWLADVINEEGYTSGAEIGCLKGVTTRHILRHCPRLKLLYAVDLWSWAPYEGGEYKKLRAQWDLPAIKKHFDQRVAQAFPDRLTVLQGLSWEMADQVEGNSLDFVFIDANHNYESVVKDIKAWTPKLRLGGMLCGHDFSEGYPGLIAAVTELVSDFSLACDRVWRCKKEDVIMEAKLC